MGQQQGMDGMDQQGMGQRRARPPPRRDYDDPFGGGDDNGMGREGPQGGRIGGSMRDGNLNSRDANYRSNPNSQYDYQGVAEMGAERRKQRQTSAAARPMPQTAGGRQAARRAARGERRADGVSFTEFESMFLALFKKQKARNPILIDS